MDRLENTIRGGGQDRKRLNSTGLEAIFMEEISLHWNKK